MRPIRGCIQRGFCAAFPAPEKKFAPHEFTLAYFRLAKKYHPDRGNRDSHELMARINAARTAILKDRQLRRR
jgi:DnaJ-class molecular chaperone